VIGDLADNRKDVGRWVTETRQTAEASAERRAAIRGSLQRLPTFLRERTPTMAALGQAADAQTPSLEDLNASADQLTRLFENVPPFSKASQTGFRTLAKASRSGRPALKAAKPTIEELGHAVADMPEVASNLAIILEHMNDRKFAVEKDPRSPGGQGYTGLEAILQYFYDQTMAINIYDANTHILKVDLFTSKCSQYQNRDSLKEKMKQDPSFYSDCAAILGPNQPGITTPDPTYTGATAAKASTARSDKSSSKSKAARRKAASRKAGTPKPNDAKTRKQAGETLRQRIEETLGIHLPQLPNSAPPALPSAGQSAPNVASTPDPQQLLDFLLGP
jgi:hypothetical protein